MANTQNYTPEQTQELVTLYKDGGVTVEDLAQKFSKTPRSIVAKLSREGVYVAKKAHSGTARAKKAEMIRELEFAFQVAGGTFQSFEKASWEAINELYQKSVS
jgi:transposase-like protein